VRRRRRRRSERLQPLGDVVPRVVALAEPGEAEAPGRPQHVAHAVERAVQVGEEEQHEPGLHHVPRPGRRALGIAGTDLEPRQVRGQGVQGGEHPGSEVGRDHAAARTHGACGGQRGRPPPAPELQDRLPGARGRTSDELGPGRSEEVDAHLVVRRGGAVEDAGDTCLLALLLAGKLALLPGRVAHPTSVTAVPAAVEPRRLLARPCHDGRMEALAELVESLPPGVVATDPATTEGYRYDWSRDTGAGTPVAVVRAEDA
jgi:hypothetical protein